MKKKGVLLIRLIVALVLAAIIFFIPNMIRDNLIVSYGIRFFKRIVTGSQIVSGIFALYGCSQAIVLVNQLRKENIQKKLDQKARSERELIEKKNQGVLSVKTKINTDALHALLQESAQKEWSQLANSIHVLEGDMNEMDELQRKLARLLKHNDASSLNNAEEVLDRVEQYMCKSIRKVINYMEVSDSTQEQERALVDKKLQACHADCKDQLKRSQDFLYALTDFLNRQGENGSDTEMIDIYKTAILEALEETV